jgi:hypothetical protein
MKTSFWFSVCLGFYFFETGSYYIAKAVDELKIILLQPPK